MRFWQLISLTCLMLWTISPADVAAQRRLIPSLGDDVQVNPAHEDRKNEADQAYRTGEHDKAIQLTSAVIAENPQDHVAFYLRASARVEKGLETGDPKEVRAGISDARSAIGLGGPDAADYYLPYLYGMTNLAALEQQPQHAKTSLTIANQVLQRPNLKPETTANIYYQRAMTNLMLEDPKAAAADYQAALKVLPTHLGAALGLPDAHLAAGDKAAAKAALDSAVQQFPNEPMVYNARGMMLQSGGDFEAGIADFTRAIEVQPEFAMGYLNRGYCLVQTGNLEAAANDFTHVLTDDPQNPMALSMRAAVRLQQGNAAAAAADFETMTRLQPEDPNAFASLGFSRYVLGQYEAAVQAFQQARQLDPDGIAIIGPWLFLSQARLLGLETARVNLRAKLPADQKAWGWVDSVEGFLAGVIDSNALRSKIDKDNPQRNTMQSCEANFFIAQRADLEGHPDVAKQGLQATLKSESKHLWAYRAAEYQSGVFKR